VAASFPVQIIHHVVSFDII